MRSQALTPLLTISMIWLVGSLGLAQDGKLDLHVTPKQAYIFVDGVRSAKRASTS